MPERYSLHERQLKRNIVVDSRYPFDSDSAQGRSCRQGSPWPRSSLQGRAVGPLVRRERPSTRSSHAHHRRAHSEWPPPPLGGSHGDAILPEPVENPPLPCTR
jgi:hypothetical protein